MFIVKNNKSSFYQIVYKINGKKTTRSTNTSSKTEAQKILEEFKRSIPGSVHKNISTLPKENIHSLSNFKSEYLKYLRPIKSKNYIESNPFTKVKFPRLTKVYHAFLTEDDLLIILANTPYQYLKDIFLVAFYTGMRLGELINMRRDWINIFNN
jgi:integrase